VKRRQTPIQITPAIAEGISAAIKASSGDTEQRRVESINQLEQRRRVVASKLDRAYEDWVSERISEDFWNRKSLTWEAELGTIDGETRRAQQPSQATAINAEKILELAKKAEILYKSQIPAEQRRLLETVLSNCTFDRGTLSPTYTSPFDLLVNGNETGNWRRGWDSNPTGLIRFCKLQIPRCRDCRRCHGCRGALHAVARTAALRSWQARSAFLHSRFSTMTAAIVARPTRSAVGAVLLPHESPPGSIQRSRRR
jgi:hypothetical protein